jgi:hypothetical protein
VIAFEGRTKKRESASFRRPSSRLFIIFSSPILLRKIQINSCSFFLSWNKKKEPKKKFKTWKRIISSNQKMLQSRWSTPLALRSFLYCLTHFLISRNHYFPRSKGRVLRRFGFYKMLIATIVRWRIPFLLLLFGIAPKSKQKGLALYKFIYPLRSKRRNFKNSRKCSDSSKLIRFFYLWGPNQFMRREGKMLRKFGFY